MAIFEDTRLLLEQYFHKLYSSIEDTTIAENLLLEIRGRLRYLQWLYIRIKKITNSLPIANIRIKHLDKIILHIYYERVPLQTDDSFEHHAQTSLASQDFLKSDIEYFYYSAFHIQEIISKKKIYLPGLNPFDVNGVRVARNNIVEHVIEGVFPCIAFTSEVVGELGGPRLYFGTHGLDESKNKQAIETIKKEISGDPNGGLWKDAIEFEKLLNESLEAGISHLVNRVSH